MKVLPLDLRTHNFSGKHSKITNAEELNTFLQSDVCAELVTFLQLTGENITNRPPSSELQTFQELIVQSLCVILAKLDSWIDDFPPIQQQMRFGNLAFRDWFAKVEKEIEPLVCNALQNATTLALGEIPLPQVQALSKELSECYLKHSFGNRIRLDFGTGHELNFIAVLLSLVKFGYLRIHDGADLIVKKLFARYLMLTRKLQSTYYLEPAGSRGAWGLDDYHFVPFLWGAYELRTQTELLPSSVILSDVAEKFHDQYLYCNAIHQIYLMKKNAPFAETSPLLHDISAIPTWPRIASGMIKMYKGEVLAKFPVMQHFQFGTIIPLKI